MAIKFSITTGTGLSNPDAANVVLRVGCCTGGTSYGRYEIDPGQDPVPAVGYGPLAAAAAQASRLGGSRQILLKIPATTPGVVSSVTKSPSNTSPLITVAGSAFDGLSDTPWDAYDLRVKVTTSGLPGAARVDVALDGGSYNYTYDVPPEPKATIDGTVDLTTVTLSTLNGTTLKPTADVGGAQTITFTTPTSVDDIAVQANAQTTNMTFSIIQGKYLRLESDTAGASSTLSIDATSTADTILGVSGTATGGASTLTLPGTGLILTFPATAAYIKDTIYSASTTAPRHSQANMDIGLAQANGDTSLVYGLLEIVQEPIDGPDLRAYATGLDTSSAAWEAQEDKRFVPYIIGAPIAATDQQIKDAMSGHVSRYGSVAAGDIYTTHTTPLPKGIMRRSACRPLGIRLAAQSLSEDPGFGGFGPLPECQMKSATGTAARNESSATVKLGGSKGPGFTVIKAKDGLPYFQRGVTRAGQASLFVDIGVQRMSAYAASIIFSSLRRFENTTFDLKADGTLQEADASALEEAFREELQRRLVQEKHASAVAVEVDRAEKVSQSRNVTVTWSVQTRGQGEDITGTLSLVGELVIAGEQAG